MTIKTEIGYSTRDAIIVRGRNLSTEIIGTFDFVDMIWWVTFARMPEPREKTMINMLLVTAADHGLTPSAITARLTWLGAPESLQGAVAAGLLGAGNTFLGTVQNVAQMLLDAAVELPDEPNEEAIAACAAALVKARRAERRPISGIGHPIHVEGDPRVSTLRRISTENGYFGKHWRLAMAIPDAMEAAIGKRLPLNAAGANGAVLADMGMDPLMGRGLALVGRAAGLIAHIVEEKSAPTGQQIWDIVTAQDPRNAAPPPR